MVPYEGSTTSMSSFSSGERDTYFKAQLDPKVVFSPLSTTEMQCRGAAAAWIARVRVAGNVDAGLTGSITGRVNLAESIDRYLFQVSLPGGDVKILLEILYLLSSSKSDIPCSQSISNQSYIDKTTTIGVPVVETLLRPSEIGLPASELNCCFAGQGKESILGFSSIHCFNHFAICTKGRISSPVGEHENSLAYSGITRITLQGTLLVLRATHASRET
ncbi:hypothetical protein NL676_022636 [Syzygium grande]|nr:hypothetical protein NL676_022636 [Syzygium grande]